VVGIQGLSVWAMKSNRGQSRASRVRGGHQVDRLMEDEGQEDTPARPQQQHRRHLMREAIRRSSKAIQKQSTQSTGERTANSMPATSAGAMRSMGSATRARGGRRGSRPASSSDMSTVAHE